MTEIREKELDANERIMNFLMDQIQDTVGVPRFGPRFPERRPPVTVSGMTLNNITVDGSTIGVLNTGNISMIDSSVTALNTSGKEEIGLAIQLLTQSVLNCKATAETKDEILEILSVISGEATQPPEKRRSRAIRPLLHRLSEWATITGGVAEIYRAVKPIFDVFFG
jgi:hypothetical protein